MKTIEGRFRWNELYAPAAADAVLLLRLSQGARLKLGGRRIESKVIEIQLDNRGRIPRGTKVIANDELKPSGTYYHAQVVDGDQYFVCAYDRQIRIVGPSPIDLTPRKGEPRREGSRKNLWRIEAPNSATRRIK